MKIRLSNEVLSESACFDTLDQVTFSFASGRHLWSVSDIEEVEKSAWLTSDLNGRSGRRNLETFHKCVTAQAYPANDSGAHTREILIVIHATQANEITIDDTIGYLSEPAYVLVENANSDGGFIDSVIAIFGRRLLSDAQTDGWWTYRHGGGIGDFPARIEELRASSRGPIRVLIVADSDSEYPGHITEATERLQRYCNQQQLPLVILGKRKIENYFPPSVLQRIFSNGSKLATARELARCNHDQRNHYEMKRGFHSSGGITIIPDTQVNLFANLGEGQRRKLCNGFGRNLAEHYVTSRSLFTEEALRSNCADQGHELDATLDHIEALL